MRPKLAETLYAKYLKEREGAFILENETTFLSYKFADKECFIINIHTEKSEQAKGNARKIIEKLAQIASDAACEVITANVYLWDANASQTLAAAIKVGFKVTAANNNVLVITKKVVGGL